MRMIFALRDELIGSRSRAERAFVRRASSFREGAPDLQLIYRPAAHSALDDPRGSISKIQLSVVPLDGAWSGTMETTRSRASIIRTSNSCTFRTFMGSMGGLCMFILRFECADSSKIKAIFSALRLGPGYPMVLVETSYPESIPTDTLALALAMPKTANGLILSESMARK